MPQWIDPRVSFGNILTIAAFVVATVVGYSNLQGRVSSTENSISELKIQYQRRDVADQREQNLLNRLEDLRARMERMEKKLDILR